MVQRVVAEDVLNLRTQSNSRVLVFQRTKLASAYLRF